MKGQVASTLVIVALIVGVGIGYVANTSGQGTVTKVTTFTYTTTINGDTTSETCIVVEYHVWSVETVGNSTTVGGTSTQSYPVTTFQTTGYPTFTSVTFTGTLMGAIDYWNDTTCS